MYWLAIGVSLLSLARRYVVLWTILGQLKAGLLQQPYTLQQQTTRPAGQSQSVYTRSCSLVLQANGPIWWWILAHQNHDCVFASCARHSWLQATPRHAWCKFDVSTAHHQYRIPLRTTPEFTTQVTSRSALPGLSNFSMFVTKNVCSHHTRLSQPPISVAQLRESIVPDKVPKDTVKKVTNCGRQPPSTDTHNLVCAIAVTPTPTHLSHIGR
ncbi:hypothetical protein BASA60_006476 [Batrachochytrium salamandrivorans]|nr:hypothetical protein BASA60_006476 [Batrachochytrium salamandrivorans]